MKNSRWTKSDAIPKYLQIPLFSLSKDEILHARIDDLTMKLDRQRKGQFGKIGRSEKRIADLEERLAILERGLCRGEIKTCEILDMAVM